MPHTFYRALYHAMIAVGKPIGGIRPRRLYDIVGKRAYPTAEFQWTRDRWGNELRLSHHYHIDRNILIYGDYDHELHRLFEQRVKSHMVALDVGANLGEMALHLGKLAGKVHAFEPMPAAQARLKEHIDRNGFQERITAWPLALGDKEGIIHMHVPREDADNQGLGSMVNPEIAAAAERIEVAASTLDAWRRHEGIGKIDFIKLDIQGAEWLFFQGAAETIRVCRPEMVMEISPGDLAQLGKTSRDLLSVVEQMGYAVQDMKGNVLRSGEVPEQFSATNVLCLPI